MDDDATGTNNGSSWTDAYNYLQNALVDAVSDDEIWVAEGIYYPDQGGGWMAGNRYAAFELANSVAVYGGFADTGNSTWQDRDPNQFETILSGDIGTSEDPSDNCYHVLYHLIGLELNATAVLDGFTITAGYADGPGFHSFGGGICNDNNNPTVTNCKFIGNVAIREGGGMFNYISSPTVTNCIFSANLADYGSGVANWSNSEPNISNCTFTGNLANYGGGMENYISSPVLTDCTFTNNQAGSGGGVYNEGSSPIVTNCIFTGNSTDYGGGGMFNYISNPVLTDCTFTNNQSGSGGGIYNEDSSPRVTECAFNGNSDIIMGGGVANWDNSKPDMNNCTFTDNSADYGGGLFNSMNSSPEVSDCIFTGNSAGNSGGGIYSQDNSDPNITGCTFINNSAMGGGGMLNSHCNPTVIDCNFISNSAQNGGGMMNGYNSPTVIGCTFSGNIADAHGGGIFNSFNSPTVSGCIFTNNSANAGGGMSNSNNISLIISYCNFSDNSAALGGGMYNSLNKPTLNNCTFTGNTADTGGGGMYNGFASSPTMTDCTFTDNVCNTDHYGAGIYNSNSTLQAANCTINGNNPTGLYFFATSTVPPAGNGYIAVSAGGFHSLALKADGSVVGWGSNLYGQATPPDNNDAYTAISTGTSHSLALKTDGSIVGWGDDDFGQSSPPAGNDYVAIAAGITHSLALKTDGSIVCWGDDSYDLSSPPAGDNYVAIAAGAFHSLALTAEGSIVGWGENSSGQSSPPAGNDYTAVSAGFMFSLALKEDGSLVGWGLDNFGQASPPAGNDYVAIAAGLDHGMALKADGTLVGWGNNEHGQADPPIGNDYTAIAAEMHNLALKTDGSIIAWPKLTMTLTDCTIDNNSTYGVWMEEYIDVEIEGNVEIVDNNWIGKDIELNGNGKLYLNPNSTLELSDSTISCDIFGTGSILVAADTELVIKGDAIVDMYHAVPVTNPAQNGTIQCDGLLSVKDNAQILNTNVIVTRASFEGDVDISNSIITAEAGSPYGQFFIEDSVTIAGNDIHADGDRYMDLDPNMFTGLIANNRIWVTITEGVGNTRGGLLELRGEDGWANSSCDPNSFFCKVEPGTIPDFDTTTWTLEELKIVEGAKVNLTNRFDFLNGGPDEVMYVKELVMEPNSVLNTSFNRFYYEANTIADSAVIKNEPLLGFSLNNIAFDNDNEFLARIVHNNYIHPDNPQYNRIHDKHIMGVLPDPNGMMRMCNLIDNYSNSPTYGQLIYARAKGTFAKSNEEEILVWFEYLFDYDSFLISRQDVELVVYLSADPELTSNRIEVASLQAPPEGRPGSTESERFGTFRQFVNTQGLNFIRGTRIELELIGPDGTSCYINNFDPQVFCRDDYCSDVTGDTQITVLDYLTVVGEYGTTADIPIDGQDSRSCLDSIFGNDGFVDWQDVTSWDWLVNQSGVGHLCAIPLTGTASGNSSISSISTSLDELPAELLIAGKRPNPSNPAQMEDKLYVVDPAGDYKANSRCILEHANARLVQDNQGQFYQVNLQAGLVSINDANDLFPPARLTYDSDPRYQIPVEVLVGLQGSSGNWVGRPIQDAVFDTAGNLYVLPVVVDPNTAGEPYMAVAQLQPLPGQNPPYQLIRLYDDPPQEGDNQERNALREVELDTEGYLYVLNAHGVNESSILWVYDTDASEPIVRVELGDPNGSTYIPGPLALLASTQSEKLYLTSSLNAPAAESATLYQMSTADFSVAEIPIPGMGHITGITENPGTGDLWVSGFTMSDIPEYLNNINLPPFYEPYLAQVSSTGVVQDVLCLTDNDPNHDLALPVSIQWTGNTSVDSCEGADIDGSGDVGLGDLARIAQAWLSMSGDGNWDQACDLSEPLNVIDFYDFAVMGRNWKEGNCQ